MSNTTFDDHATVVVSIEEFAALGPAARDRAYKAVEAARMRLLALEARMLAAVALTKSYLTDIHLQPRAWSQAVLNTTCPTAVRRMQQAMALAAMPELLDAVEAGRVGEDQLNLFARLYANPRVRDLLVDEFQTMLVSFACTLRMWDFKQACQRFEQLADVDGTDRTKQVSRENRKASFATLDDGFVLSLEGDGLTGAIIKDILDAYIDIEVQRDLDARKAEWGDDAMQHPLARTATQRAFDAFYAMCLSAADGNPKTARLPMVNIFTNQTELEAALTELIDALPDDEREDAASIEQSLFDDDEHLDDDEHFDDGDTDPAAAGPRNDPTHSPFGVTADGQPIIPLPVRETASGVGITRKDLVLAALLGRVRHICTDPTGRIIQFGRSKRLFTGGAREAVLLTTLCQKNGCERDGPRIQADHTNPFSHLGRTDADEGGPACGSHNRMKHKYGITTTRDHTGWHFWRPDGTEIAPRDGP